MTEEQLENLKYPIGRLVIPENINIKQIKDYIDIIKQFPIDLINGVKELTEDQLNTPYRENGWTLKQVVHHIADSHLNAFIRFKLTLTEENVSVKPYSQTGFAELADGLEAPIEASLKLIEGLHIRWTVLLESMKIEDYDKTYYHSEYQRYYVLKNVLALYSWHGNHHLAHITNLKTRMGW